jgi:amino acid adenylation domain-containing protein
MTAMIATKDEAGQAAGRPPAGGFEAWPFEPFPAAALDGSVLDRFDAVAARNPERLAVGDTERSLTYGELAALAAQAGAALAAMLDRPGPVAILLKNEARYAVAMLAAMAAGRPYVPLDLQHPAERNRQIAAQAGAAAAIVAGGMPGHDVLAAELPVLDLDRIDGSATRLPSRLRPGPDDLAYITYTSGSTGRPKGVCQNHRGLLHDVMQSINTLRLSAADRTSAFHSPSLLQGTRIAFGALLAGGSVHMLRPAEAGPAGIAAEIKRRGITVFRSIAGLFTAVAATLAAGERLDSLRLVYLGGDRVTWADYDVFRRACRPDAAFGVHLGATECSTVYLQWLVEELTPRGLLLPIGRPLADRAVELVDDEGGAVPAGSIGEFAVTSRHVALGYWREPELTARAFRADANDPAARTYRTGDLGRLRPDGLYEFVGRKDAQLKINGHRIEPGEVEAALRAAPPVKDAAVVVRRGGDGAARALIGYVELRPGVQGLLPRHLLAMAARVLPAAMVPARIVLSESLPRLPSLKVDRARLAAIDAAAMAGASTGDVDPRLQRIIAVFEEVLQVGGATPEDNLRTLGGNSLQAVELALALEQRLGISIPVGSFQASRSIRELAVRLGELPPPPPASSGPALTRYGERFEPAPGSLGEFRAAAAPLDAVRPCLAELNAAHAEGREVALDAAPDLAIWANALDVLFLAGKMEVLEHGARQLATAHPGFDYAETVAAFFDRRPAAGGDLLPFDDKRLAPVQIVPRAGAETVLILFADRFHTLGMPLPAIHRWLGRLPASLIYLRDFRRLYYLAGVPELGTDRAATVAALRATVAALGGRRILCYGNSAGSFAALDYGAALGAEAVLAMAGPTNLRPEFNAHLRWVASSLRLHKAMPDAVADLRPLFTAGAPVQRFRIVFGEHDWDDRLQAENLAGAANAELVPVPGYLGHNVTMELVRRGGFGAMLDWLTG